MMMELSKMIQQKRELDAQIAKACSKEGKAEIKRIVKEYKIPATYLVKLAERVKNNPSIYA